MPEWICAECKYEARDKYSMERHLNRKYPCNSVGIASKEKLEIKKLGEIKKQDLEPKEKEKLKFKIKTRNDNFENNKLEKE